MREGEKLVYYYFTNKYLFNSNLIMPNGEIIDKDIINNTVMIARSNNVNQFYCWYRED